MIDVGSDMCLEGEILGEGQQY